MISPSNESRRFEHNYLRAEIVANKKLVFERALVIAGAGLAAATLPETVEGIGWLGISIVGALAFNLWFTVNRLKSNGRIIAFIQLFHESQTGYTWVGWETSLRLNRIWEQHCHEEFKAVKSLFPQIKQYDNLRFFGALLGLHVAVTVAVAVMMSVRLLADPLPGVQIAIPATAIVTALAFAIWALAKYRPKKLRYEIEKDLLTWKAVFDSYENGELRRIVDDESATDKPLEESGMQELRRKLARGAGATQAQLDSVAAEMQPQKAALRPNDKDELLPLFDDQGKATGMKAPRWICHVLGLRHCCADVLLIWRSPTMGETLLLQIRSWDKDDSPGCLDISASGHMTATDQSSEETALAEMRQETNLSADDLVGNTLHALGGYACDEPPRPAESFFNSEWRDIYLAYVTDEGLKNMGFPDGEVAGVVLFPLKDAQRLLTQTSLPLASSLVHSLPICLAHVEGEGSGI